MGVQFATSLNGLVQFIVLVQVPEERDREHHYREDANEGRHGKTSIRREMDKTGIDTFTEEIE